MKVPHPAENSPISFPSIVHLRQNDKAETMGGAYDITGSRVSISFYSLAFTIEERDGDEEEEKNEIHLSKALKSVDIFFMKLKDGRFFLCLS